MHHRKMKMMKHLHQFSKNIEIPGIMSTMGLANPRLRLVSGVPMNFLVRHFCSRLLPNLKTFQLLCRVCPPPANWRQYPNHGPMVPIDQHCDSLGSNQGPSLQGYRPDARGSLWGRQAGTVGPTRVARPVLPPPSRVH